MNYGVEGKGMSYGGTLREKRGARCNEKGMEGGRDTTVQRSRKESEKKKVFVSRF